MKTHCTHSQVAFVGTLGKGCKIHAGGIGQAKPIIHTFDLIISLLGYDPVSSSAEVQMNRGAALALPSLRQWMDRAPTHRCLSIDWPDRDVPELSLKFWKNLLHDLEAFNGKMLVHCFGGHGRTGTALSILAKLGGMCGSEDPVKWVRRNYCMEAVESRSQIKYINGLGLKTTAKASDELKPKSVSSGFTYQDWKPGQGAPLYEGLGILTDDELDAGESTGDEQEDVLDRVKREEREERLRKMAGVGYKGGDLPRKQILIVKGRAIHNEFVNDGSEKPWLNKR